MRWSGGRPTGNGRITTRGRVARIRSMSLARDGSSFWRWASGSPALSRTCTPSARVACSASAARVVASPRVPVSPCVRSRMPTRWPARTALASVPPHVSSTSSRCAAIARRSTGWFTNGLRALRETAGEGGRGPSPSFVSQRFDRIQPRRPVGGHDADDHSDRDRDDSRHGGAPQRDGRREAQQRLEDFARGETEHDADHAAHERESGGLDEKLPQDFPAGRSHRFAESDLARPVGDGDHHDRHDADAAHHEGDAREHEHHEKKRGGEAIEHTQHLVRREHVEAVGLAHANAPHAPQLQRDRIHRPGHADAGDGPHENDQSIHLVELEVTSRRLERHDAGDLRRTRELEDVGGSLVHADHPEGTAADLDQPVDGVERPEQAVHRAPLHDDHRRPRPALGWREQPAAVDAAAQDLHETVVRAEQGEGLGADAAVLEPVEQLRPNRGVVDLGESRDRLRLLGLEHRALPDLPGKGVGVDRRLAEESQHAERRGADDLQSMHDLLAESRDDRGHGHHGRDSDHDTEHREGRAGLVGSQLLEGDQPAFADGVEPHSARSAAMGSSRAARVAGYTPNNTPTVSPRLSATPTDHPVTRAGSGVAAATSPASAMPAARPSTPPTSESVTDSARNWRRMARRVAPSDLRIPISRVRSVTLMSMMFMITMPPTTMPMATTAGTTVKMTRVRLCQKEMSPSAVSTLKSSSWPGRSRCAIRIASSARSMASATCSAAGILTEITVVWRRPYSASNVVSGSITNPSHDWPSTVPFFAITPLIVNVQPRTRTRRPTARATSSKSFSATSNPSTATRRRCCTSTSVRGSPAAIW